MICDSYRNRRGPRDSSHRTSESFRSSDCHRCGRRRYVHRRRHRRRYCSTCRRRRRHRSLRLYPRRRNASLRNVSSRLKEYVMMLINSYVLPFETKKVSTFWKDLILQSTRALTGTSTSVCTRAFFAVGCESTFNSHFICINTNTCRRLSVIYTTRTRHNYRNNIHITQAPTRR